MENELSQDNTDFLTEYNLMRKLEHGLLFSILIKAGLYPGQLPVLNYVREHEGCTQTEIAKCLNVSAASIASSTKRLQKNGMILKKSDQLNLRANMLYLTPKGRELTCIYQMEINQLRSGYMNGFSESEKKQFISFLKRINQNILNIKSDGSFADKQADL